MVLLIQNIRKTTPNALKIGKKGTMPQLSARNVTKFVKTTSDPGSKCVIVSDGEREINLIQKR